MLTSDKLVLAAPLAGVSDTVFRKWARRFGANIVFTGMVSAEGIRRRDEKSLSLLYYEEDEHPVGAQLFDSSPEAIAEASKIVEAMGFDFIDINLGCPARKVISRGAGASLLREPDKAVNLVKAARDVVDIPVSAKIRTGWENTDLSYREIVPRLSEIGVDFITVHPRSRNEMFSGHSNWDIIKETVALSDVPIVGNGDIYCGEDALRLIDLTGCSSVMIGRGSLGNPWIFSKVAAALAGEDIPKEPSEDERIEVCAEYVSDLISYYGERRGVRISRKHVAWFTRGLPGCKAIRIAVFSAESADEIYRALGLRKVFSYANT